MVQGFFFARLARGRPRTDGLEGIGHWSDRNRITLVVKVVVVNRLGLAVVRGTTFALASEASRRHFLVALGRDGFFSLVDQLLFILLHVREVEVLHFLLELPFLLALFLDLLLQLNNVALEIVDLALAYIDCDRSLALGLEQSRLQVFHQPLQVRNPHLVLFALIDQHLYSIRHFFACPD